jgi:hypothetical protein
MRTILSFLIVFFIYFSYDASAQKDTLASLPYSHTDPKKIHSPKVATYLSIIPGAGQIYNEKYWKVPIIYAGLGTAAYFIYTYNKTTQYYRDEYLFRLNNNVPFHNPELEDRQTDNILALRNIYRTRMEISIAAFAIVYALNIVDAAVDAHLYYFDVSEDLSMTIKPTLLLNQSLGNYSFAPGIGLKLKIR